MNHWQTLIAVADDCPVSAAVVPVARGGRKTIAVIQYELLSTSPYKYTSAQVLFECSMRHQGLAAAGLKTQPLALWDAFFAKPQACLRASALPKKYGFGLHCDADGKVALCAMESADYRRLSRSKTVQVFKAMPSPQR